MNGRFAAIVSAGFTCFFVIGAAGAASDSYFETKLVPETTDIVCDGDFMANEHSKTGTPDCSGHRVSATYGRQLMAMNLTKYGDQVD